MQRQILPSEKECFTLLVDAGENEFSIDMSFEQQCIFSADIILNLAEVIRAERKQLAWRVGLSIESNEVLRPKLRTDIFRNVDNTNDNGIYKRYGKIQEGLIYLRPED